MKKTYLTHKTYKKLQEKKKETIVFEAREQKQFFPKISLNIPDFSLKWFSLNMVLTSVCLFLLGVLIYTILPLGKTSVAYFSLRSTIETTKKQQAYWQGIVHTYPTYRDGYFMLALLSYKLGETKQIEEALQKVHELDPNFQKGKEFASKVGVVWR